MHYVIPNDPAGRIVDVFLGIPFAAPPVGELRFEKPIKAKAWPSDTPLICRRYKPMSLQKRYPIFDIDVPSSEDCLYLNVMTPTWKRPEARGNSLFPVLVYCHGGGFIIDSAAAYRWEKLVDHCVKHDVVVVTIQYRLGPLGYFCTSDDTIQGNFGLWDQYFAFQWIYDNIKEFGGDPLNITGMGQSAGAVSVHLLSILPMSKHLFAKTILLGGSVECGWAVTARTPAARLCQQLALRMGYRRKHGKGYTEPWCAEENAKLKVFLKSAPTSKLLVSMIGLKMMMEVFRLPLSPIVDGDLVPFPPNVLLQDAPNRPSIRGISRYEGMIFLSFMRQLYSERMLRHFEKQYKFMIESISKVLPPEEVANFYPDKFDELHEIDKDVLSNKMKLRYKMAEVCGNITSNWAFYTFLQNAVARGSTATWALIFEHHNPDILKLWSFVLPFNGKSNTTFFKQKVKHVFSAPTHGTELAYMFGVNIFRMKYKPTPVDLEVSEKMQRAITNFAKYGNPNGDPLYPASCPYSFSWEPVTKENPCRNLRVSPTPIVTDDLPNDYIVKLSPLHAKYAEVYADEKYWKTVGSPNPSAEAIDLNMVETGQEEN
uniref:COesterase domain-containing protein n=1 Tax=Panagrellus redivivus TaxID=6233 RepID=A0A7E4ZYY6_PANRE